MPGGSRARPCMAASLGPRLQVHPARPLQLLRRICCIAASQPSDKASSRQRPSDAQECLLDRLPGSPLKVVWFTDVRMNAWFLRISSHTSCDDMVAACKERASGGESGSGGGSGRQAGGGAAGANGALGGARRAARAVPHRHRQLLTRRQGCKGGCRRAIGDRRRRRPLGGSSGPAGTFGTLPKPPGRAAAAEAALPPMRPRSQRLAQRLAAPRGAPVNQVSDSSRKRPQAVRGRVLHAAALPTTTVVDVPPSPSRRASLPRPHACLCICLHPPVLITPCPAPDPCMCCMLLCSNTCSDACR